MSKTIVTPETLVLREVLDARRDECQALLDKDAATRPSHLGSVARCTFHAGSGVGVLVELDPADGNLLIEASGLVDEPWGAARSRLLRRVPGV